jgi:hypothetical protein
MAVLRSAILVSESTLDTPYVPLPASASGPAQPPAPGPEPWTLRVFARRQPWWTTAFAVIAISVLLVLWAGTRPGFDPYGWLTWGHRTLHGGLDTNAAPSWKPLPYIFTTIFALAGHYEMRLWMFFSTAVALSGVVFAGRVAYKLTGAAPERRWPAFAAAVFAGAALLGMRDELNYSYFHYILSSQSDPMIVSLCLAAIDMHLEGHPRWAFVLGSLAALGRPEVWPFLGLWMIWCWRARPDTRWLLAGGTAVMALLWFGIPALTSRTPFVAASNAMDSGRAPQGDRVTAVIHRFVDLHHWPLEIAALLGVGVAAVRRELTTLVLAGGVVVWVIVEIAFALHGWPGLGRYMFEAAGVMVVLAGAFVGRVLNGLPRIGGFALPSRAGAVVAALIVVALIPPAVSAARAEHKDIAHQRLRTAEINRLSSVVAEMGGAGRIRACGESLTRLTYQTALAYTIGENVSQIGFKYGQAIGHGNPIVLFTPFETGTGWQVRTMHQLSAGCRAMPQPNR